MTLRTGWTFAFAAAFTMAVAQTRGAGDEVARLARWKTVAMPFHAAGLSARERQMVEKLLEASRLLDRVFWRQYDPEGYDLYRATTDQTLKELLGIMGGRWDLVDGNRPFAGAPPMPPGHAVYPRGITREEIERAVAVHPGDRAAIYAPYTVVERRGERLAGVPYHVAYRDLTEPMARALRDAAALSDDPAFARFLRLRADALLTDDYYASDLAWVDLKDPKFDVIFAPYESYPDELLGVKGFYGAAVMVRNEPESRKLALYQRYVADIQDALPVPAPDRPSKRGHAAPMEVMDVPYRGGELRHGYQAVADNLPNDPRVHQEKGSKQIFFKNFMDARVNEIVLPVAARVMDPAQARLASAEGYLAAVVMHEIAHGLGPAFAHRAGKQVAINEAIGPAYAALEEAKADVTGMFGLEWLMRKGAIAANRREEYYASYVAGIFRSVRFGAAEAHSKAELMEFNYLVESGAVRLANGRYSVNYAKAPAALAALTRELLTIEAAGDRARAEAWFAKYGNVPDALKTALAATGDIPVDIAPVFSFADER
ncbi:MAG: Zn-dependent hydrolase [Acidobacteria bacterium]|nr:Zn-dependent hydrolase [Acidobacteriota bacterium]